MYTLYFDVVSSKVYFDFVIAKNDNCYGISSLTDKEISDAIHFLETYSNWGLHLISSYSYSINFDSYDDLIQSYPELLI